jgi:Ca-activated chloride channel homolog
MVYNHWDDSDGNFYYFGNDSLKENSMIWGNYSYDYPEAAYLFFGLIPILFFFGMLFRYRTQMLEKFADKAIISKLLIPRSKSMFFLQVGLFCIAWLFTVLALMGPKGNGHYPPWEQKMGNKSKNSHKEQFELKRKAHKIVFLIDASASMSVNDSNGETRLSNAKDIVDEVVSDLTGESVALYAFTSEVTKLVPSTMDYLFFRLMLPQIKINEGGVAGTNIKEAISQMNQREFSKPSEELNTLIILSDGGDTEIDSSEGGKRGNGIEAIANLEKNAKELKLRVIAVGIGSREGKNIPGIEYKGKPVHSSLESDLLKKLSEVGRGQYFQSNDYQTVPLAKNILDFMNKDSPFLEKQNVVRNEKASQEDLIYDLYFQYPLGLAIFFLALAIILPETQLRVSRKIITKIKESKS